MTVYNLLSLLIEVQLSSTLNSTCIVILNQQKYYLVMLRDYFHETNLLTATEALTHFKADNQSLQIH